MIVNFIVIILILFLGLMFLKHHNPNSSVIRKKYIKIICFILILQSGLRNVAVGDDTFAYKEGFEDVTDTSWGEIKHQFENYFIDEKVKDPGYIVFQKIVQFFTNDYQIFLLLVAVLFFSAFGMFIYNNTDTLKHVIFAFVIYMALFYWFFSITGIRQTLATAFTIFAFELLKKRKFIWFFILVFLAINMHKTALVFLPMFFIYLIKNTKVIKVIYVFMLLLFPVFMVFRNNLVLIAQNAFGYKEYEEIQESGTFTFTFLILSLSMIALFNSRSLLKIKNEMKYFYFAFAMVIILVPLSYINPSLLRIVMYYSIFIMVFTPYIIESFSIISLKLSKDLYVVGISVILLLFLKTNLNSPEYGFFWEEMRLSDHYFIEE